MSNSTSKKVRVQRFGQVPLDGHVSPHQFLGADGIEILARTAKAVFIPYRQIRAVHFVRDFDGAGDGSQRTVFVSRPKRGGLWVRVRFLDGEELEGVIPNDLRIMGEHGVTLTPPDSKGNTQKVFVPSSALDSFVVMGVIGKPNLRAAKRAKPEASGQMGLFGEQPQA